MIAPLNFRPHQALRVASAGQRGSCPPVIAPAGVTRATPVIGECHLVTRAHGKGQGARRPRDSWLRPDYEIHIRCCRAPLSSRYPIVSNQTTRNNRPRQSTYRPAQNRNQDRDAAPRADENVLTLRGTVTVNPRGFGFVTPVDTTQPDVFLPPPLLESSRLIDADVVDVSYVIREERTTAVAVQRVERVRTRIVGVVGPGAVLAPDPFVAPYSLRIQGACPNVGTTVLAEFTGPAVRVIEQYGAVTDPLAVYARALERTRLAETIAANPIKSVDVPTARPTAGPRRDLTGLLTFTIDGPESRDLDDAVSVEAIDRDTTRLYVHIADVAAVVTPASGVDRRARALGTSTYLPGYSIPMIVPELAYDGCSLLPGVERDTLTVEMVVGADGVPTALDVYESRIRSDVRYDYASAAAVLATPATITTPGEAALRLAHATTQRLAVPRAARGGLRGSETQRDHELTVVDGHFVPVPDDHAALAHQLIEEAMVAANEAVAQWLVARGLPGIFRVHARPQPGAALAMTAFANYLGAPIDLPEELTPLDLSRYEEHLRAAGHEIDVLNVLGDYLARAQYTPQAGEHFGLASDGYLHFTSPIRRYADLTVHRIIKAHLAGTTYGEDLTVLCAQINRASDLAARSESVARALALAGILARTRGALTATVSRLSSRGVFVRLEESGASGWIPARVLAPGSTIEVADPPIALRCSAGVYHVSDPVQVRVLRADVEAGQVDFALATASRPADTTRRARPTVSRR